ncbi:MAG: hypothetical protein U1E65_27595 [Myxococcota bacterium]
MRPALWLCLASLTAPWCTAAEPAPAVTDAIPADDPAPLRLEVLGTTTLPLELGAGVRLVLFDHVLLGGGVGKGTYGGVLADLAKLNGQSAAAPFVERLGDELLGLRALAGLRPFTGLGLELTVGYLRASGSASLAAAELATLSGLRMPYPSATASYVLHAITFELGWTFVAGDHFLIRPALGWAQTLGASASLAVSGTPTALVKAALAAAGQAVGDALPSYARTPTLSLAIGWRF